MKYDLSIFIFSSGSGPWVTVSIWTTWWAWIAGK